MDYRITIQTQDTSLRHNDVFYDNDSDMFHAVCRALESLDRSDVKVTVELMKE